MAKTPVADQVQVNFRMPADLRDRIKARAEKNGTSMNAEIIEALETIFPAPRGPEEIVNEITETLSWIEPKLREETIALLAKQASNGEISRWADAFAHADRDRASRFPWEDT